MSRRATQYFRWTDEQFYEFFNKFIEYIREGYDGRHAAELTANEMGLTYYQTYGQFVSLKKKYPELFNIYQEALKNRTLNPKLKDYVKWTNELKDELLETIANIIKNGGNETIGVIDFAKNHNMMVYQAESMWRTLKTKNKNKRNEKQVKNQPDLQQENEKLIEENKKLKEMVKKLESDNEKLLNICNKLSVM